VSKLNNTHSSVFLVGVNFLDEPRQQARRYALSRSFLAGPSRFLLTVRYVATLNSLSSFQEAPAFYAWGGMASPYLERGGRDCRHLQLLCNLLYLLLRLRHSASPERDSSPHGTLPTERSGFPARTPCRGKTFSVDHNAPCSEVVRPRWVRTGLLSEGSVEQQCSHDVAA